MYYDDFDNNPYGSDPQSSQPSSMYGNFDDSSGGQYGSDPFGQSSQPSSIYDSSGGTDPFGQSCQPSSNRPVSGMLPITGILLNFVSGADTTDDPQALLAKLRAEYDKANSDGSDGLGNSERSAELRAPKLNSRGWCRTA